MSEREFKLERLILKPWWPRRHPFVRPCGWLESRVKKNLNPEGNYRLKPGADVVVNAGLHRYLKLSMFSRQKFAWINFAVSFAGTVPLTPTLTEFRYAEKLIENIIEVNYNPNDSSEEHYRFCKRLMIQSYVFWVGVMGDYELFPFYFDWYLMQYPFSECITAVICDDSELLLNKEFDLTGKVWNKYWYTSVVVNPSASSLEEYKIFMDSMKDVIERNRKKHEELFHRKIQK